MLFCFAQATQPIWTENDRQFLVENLERTRNEMMKEAEKLSPRQWHFKETDTSWSIAKVVEHMGLYERTFLAEATVIRQGKPVPELATNARADSSYLAWMNDPQPM